MIKKTNLSPLNSGQKNMTQTALEIEGMFRLVVGLFLWRVLPSLGRPPDSGCPVPLPLACPDATPTRGGISPSPPPSGFLRGSTLLILNLAFPHLSFPPFILLLFLWARQVPNHGPECQEVTHGWQHWTSGSDKPMCSRPQERSEGVPGAPSTPRVPTRPSPALALGHGRWLP